MFININSFESLSIMFQRKCNIVKIMFSNIDRLNIFPILWRINLQMYL